MDGLDIAAIRGKCQAGAIRWSAHAAARMLQRGITREDVVSCILNGEIIEQYPEYWLNPACLVFGLDESERALHVVVGMDEFAHVVTAYRPDSATFMPDMKNEKGKIAMACFYCKGEMHDGTTVFTVQLETCLVVIKNVPCLECSQCGETEITDETMKAIERIIETCKMLVQEVAVVDYHLAA